MLNTLANHGFLPHDGKDISANKTIDALKTALNIDETLGKFLFDFAVTTNPDPNATVFSLNHLSRHNILEHDASLRSVTVLWTTGYDQHTDELTGIHDREAVRMLSTQTLRSSTRPSSTRHGHTGKGTQLTCPWPQPPAMHAS